jgi:hypothetical protein
LTQLIDSIFSAYNKAKKELNQSSFSVSDHALLKGERDFVTVQEFKDKYPPLKPIGIYLEELCNLSELATFSFFDYKPFPLSSDPTKAFYIILNGIKDNFKKYEENLAILYTPETNPEIPKQIYDSNKPLQKTHRFDTYIVSKDEVKNPLPGAEFFINHYLDIIDQNNDKGIEQIYNEYSQKTNQERINLLNRLDHELLKEILREKEQEVDRIQYTDAFAAFFTYLHFISRITPTDWREYIYYPCSILTPDSEVKWIGGLLLAYKRPTSFDERLAFRHTINSLISCVYTQPIYKTLETTATRSAISAIMGRNMSHNIGSHVLATLTNKGYISENPQSIIAFNSYLQKRMDLIARMAGGQTASGEPMYFVGDLLNGFFKQVVLLNHLIKDQGGFEKERINFRVCLNGDTAVNFTYQKIDDRDCKAINNSNDDCMRWLPDEEAKINDFLVSTPDGEVGCQALYVFLESMMRNSAKYGLNRTAKECQITIKVEAKNRYYRISICDNLSLCQANAYEGNVVAGMRAKIEEPLVDSYGQLSAKSLGIAEMRAACEFLMKPFDEKYPAYTANDYEKYPLGVVCPGPNDCHRETTIKDIECEEGQCCNHLAYVFHLMKPQMAAVIGNGTGIIDNEKYGIKHFNKLSDLKDPKNSYQFVTVYVTDENKQEIFQTLKSHYVLPFRMLIIGKYSGIDLDFVNDLPQRRVTICPAQEICIDDTSQDAGAENFIISVYEAWIRNRWLNKNRCSNLVLAFDRDEKSEVFKRYETIDSLRLISDKINWSVYRTYEKSGVFKDERKYGRESDGNYLIYDNHAAFKKAKGINSPDFHHLIGEGNNKIFEALASPPANDFSFKYFLLSVLEASLTKVVIIDERVAEACIDDKNDYDISHLNSLNNCLCYPVFKINAEPLNTVVNDKINALTSASPDNKKMLSELTCENDEGRYVVKNETSIKITEADHVIIHYGLIETHEKLKRDDFRQLYSLAPSIVITSGRGAGTIKKGDDDTNKLPFLEASILKDNTYPSVSKYHLTRALMSIKGEA